MAMARLRILGAWRADGSGPVDLTVDGDRIEAIEDAAVRDGSRQPDDQVIDGRGLVILPRVTDAHIHLDKSLAGTEWIAIPQARDWREKSRIGERMLLDLPGSLVDRIATQAERVVANGTRAVRNHATISEPRGVTAVEAVLEVRQRLAGRLHMQVVAFPQHGAASERMRDLLDEAMLMGCDVVGGIDPATYDRDIDGQLRTIVSLAMRYDTPIDIHLHDPGHLGLFEIDRICDYAEAEDIGRRVTISHGLALGELAPREARPVLDRLARLGITIVTNANPDVAMPRLAEVDAAGVRLGVGSDAAHSVLPFGTSDMFKKANLIAQRHILVSEVALMTTWRRITEVNATILGIDIAEPATGVPADFLLVSGRNAAEAIVSPPRDRIVIVSGEIVADSRCA
jgi:cytosine deaminase